jgi:hypothetical protein
MFLLKNDILERSLYQKNIPIELRIIIRNYTFNILDPRFLKNEKVFCISGTNMLQIVFNENVLNKIHTYKQFIGYNNFSSICFFCVILNSYYYYFKYDIHTFRISNEHYMDLSIAKLFMNILDEFCGQNICYKVII